MNLLSHFFCAQGASEPYRLGSALPDLVGLYSRRMRLPPLEAHWDARADAPESMREVLAGVRFHHHVDREFHHAPLFRDAADAVGSALREADGGPGLKRFFPAHVLTEMYLDHLLIRETPALTAAFTTEMQAGQALLVDFAAPHPHPDAGEFPGFLDVILADRYWEDYREVPGLFKRMNRILRRFGQRAITAAEERAVSEALHRQRNSLSAALNAFIIAMRAALPITEPGLPRCQTGVSAPPPPPGTVPS